MKKISNRMKALSLYRKWYARSPRMIARYSIGIFIVIIATGFFLSFSQTHATTTTYYVSTSGSDSNSGLTNTSSGAWQTLAHACTAVSAPGSIIHIDAGQYTEANRCNLAVGVSIEGEGSSNTHVTLTYNKKDVHDAAIFLNSTTESSSGNQSISNIAFDGNHVDLNPTGAWIGILVRARNNVLIHDNTFTNFQASAVSFDGILTNRPPKAYATGNQFYNNTTTKCSDRQLGGAGAIQVSGQSNMLIHDNTFDQSTNAQTHNGDVLGAVNGYNKEIKYYNNVSYQLVVEGASNNIGIESWYDQGGWEVYGNTFSGGGGLIDIAYHGGNKGSDAYSWYIHDNLFESPTQLPTFQTVAGSNGSQGIQFELDGWTGGDAIISNNHFKNIGTALQITNTHAASEVDHNIHFQNNLLENIGYADSGYGGFMVYILNTVGASIDSVYIDNNTMIGGIKSGTTNGAATAGVFIESASTLGPISNIFIRNNIVQNVTKYGYLTLDGSQPISNLVLQNNNPYNNSNSNTPFIRTGDGTPSVTYAANSANITTDPLLDSTFHLKAGSPVIDKGINVGLPYIGAAPDIGDFESGGTGDSTLPSVALTAPLSGSVISGTAVTVAATASDNTAVSKVEFYKDGTLMATDTASPYATSLDASVLANGTHTLQAKAYDAAGNVGVSSTISVTVSNTVADTTAPTVALTAPTGGIVLGTINVAATASDNVGVTKVEFYKDSTLMTSDTTSPYTTSLDTTTLSDGLHTLQAKAYDAAGNVNTASVIVTVSNAAVDITAPTVSLTAPTSGATISGTTTLSATASDNVAVTHVDFYQGTSLIASDTTSPYSATLDTTTLANGTYSLSAKAYDAAGNSKTSSSVSVSVSNTVADTTAPSITLTAPTSGASVSGTMTVSATASDNIGVTKVEFYKDTEGTPFATDTTSPYSVSLDTSTLAAGAHSIKGRAYDAAGNATGTAWIPFSVLDTTAPTVALTAPTSGATLSNTATVSATASDNVGIDHIDFYNGTTLIGADATAPYSISWDTSSVANGTYSLSAKAYDAAGNTKTSSTVSVSVSNVVIPPPDTTAPAISLTEPTAGATIGGTTTLSANASDNVGVTKVSFYRGTTLIDTDTTASPGYAVTWDTTGVADGTYSLSAKAYDAAGNVGTTSTVSITVKNADTTAPSVSLTAPTAGASVSGSTTLAATASDNIAVTHVDFYNGTTMVASDATAPYSSAWDTTTVANGTYSLSAKAYDAAGNTKTSSTVSVSVSNNVVDTTAPSVSFTYPLTNGAVPRGDTTTLVAAASDNVAVTKVQFYQGSTLLCTATTLTSGSYTCDWSVPTKKGFLGIFSVNYTLKATAYDAAGNSTSASVKVKAS